MLQRCSAWAFSGCSEWELLLVAGFSLRGLLWLLSADSGARASVVAVCGPWGLP